MLLDPGPCICTWQRRRPVTHVYDPAYLSPHRQKSMEQDVRDVIAQM